MFFGCVAALLGLAVTSTLGLSTFLLGVSYLVAQVLYVLKLKHVAVVDLILVALGFVLRAAAGGTATGVPVSHWFLLVSLFGALFLVTGKRKAERMAAGEPTEPQAAVSRPVLAAYPDGWLDQVMTVALLGAALSYGSWAFQHLGYDVYRELLADLVPAVPDRPPALRVDRLDGQRRGPRTRPVPGPRAADRRPHLGRPGRDRSVPGLRLEPTQT